MILGLVAVRSCLATMLLLVVLHFYWAVTGLRESRQLIGVKESLRRLSILTIRNFPDRNISAPEAFWAAIGRPGNPMRDIWGTEYRLESRAGKGKQIEFFWRSAGLDRKFESRDDILLQVPFPEKLDFGQDPGPLDNIILPSPSTNAR